jgi:hypothetical protein
MAVRPRKKGRITLRLALWDIHGRKLELEEFLSEHGIDICLLNEMYPQSDQAVRFGNYVHHRMDRSTRGEGKTILVRRGINCYSVPVWGRQHLEATAIHLILVTRPVKLVAAYVSPTRPLIQSDLTESLSGELPVLMAGDSNANTPNGNFA